MELMHAPAEYCVQVWRRGTNTGLVVVGLNAALRTVTVCLHPTLVDQLPVLAGIASPAPSAGWCRLTSSQCWLVSPHQLPVLAGVASPAPSPGWYRLTSSQCWLVSPHQLPVPAGIASPAPSAGWCRLTSSQSWLVSPHQLPILAGVASPAPSAGWYRLTSTYTYRARHMSSHAVISGQYPCRTLPRTYPNPDPDQL